MDLNKLEEAWVRGVGADYNRGFLVSEASLQASLYHHLRKVLGGSHTLFVQPKVQYHNNQPQRIPDLIIVGESEISAIIELKFFPWWTPNRSNFHQDIVHLWNFRERSRKENDSEREYRLYMDPLTGYENSHKTRILTRDTVFVFGIVCGDAKSQLQCYTPDEGMWMTKDDCDSLVALHGDISKANPSFAVSRGMIGELG